jgi:hypothetical protein
MILELKLSDIRASDRVFMARYIAEQAEKHYMNSDYDYRTSLDTLNRTVNIRVIGHRRKKLSHSVLIAQRFQKVTGVPYV